MCRSIVEAFAQQGRGVVTTRIYPKSAAPSVALINSGTTNVTVTVTVYHMEVANAPKIETLLAAARRYNLGTHSKTDDVASGAQRWSGQWNVSGPIGTSRFSQGRTPAGPLLGNGDAGVVLDVDRNNLLVMRLSANSFWHLDDEIRKGRGGCYRLAIGGLTFRVSSNNTQEDIGSSFAYRYTFKQIIADGSAQFAIWRGNQPILNGTVFLSQTHSGNGPSTLVTTVTALATQLSVQVLTWAFFPVAEGPGLPQPKLPKTLAEVTGLSSGAPVTAWARRQTNGSATSVTGVIVTSHLAGVDGQKQNDAAVQFSSKADSAGTWLNFSMPPMGETVSLVHSIVASDNVSVANALSTHSIIANAEVVEKLALESRAFWSTFWNCSSVSLPTRPKAEAYW
eukprot:SAG31_NODE_3658_length_4017_cov_1.748596_2_plen_395_part_00